MAGRVAHATGTVTTVFAGLLLGALGLSVFGELPTFLLFAALALLASVAQRGMSRRR